VGALYFNTQQTSEALQATRDQIGVSQQGQLTDRFSKAVEQLGNKDSLEVRLGGIYALERIARDSARDHPTVMEVLSAYVREHAPLSLCSDVAPPARPSTDVQAILTVIGRRDAQHDRDALDLNGTCLRGAELNSANLACANLAGADLVDVNLGKTFRTDRDSHLVFPGDRGANLSGASLVGANFATAILNSADLTGVDLSDATLPGASLFNAKLYGASLYGADLTGAGLAGADLTGADITSADLTQVDRQGVDLSRIYVPYRQRNAEMLPPPTTPHYCR